jgi:hypothetical protein
MRWPPSFPAQRDSAQFLEAEQTIQVLQCLCRRPLEQVVEGGDDDHALAVRRQRETAEGDVMVSGDPADPGCLLEHLQQGLVRVEVAIVMHDLVPMHGLPQMEVDRHRDAAKVRCHVRHELHRNAQLMGDLALVYVSDQGIGHEVVAQFVGVVAV